MGREVMLPKRKQPILISLFLQPDLNFNMHLRLLMVRPEPVWFPCHACLSMNANLMITKNQSFHQLARNVLPWRPEFLVSGTSMLPRLSVLTDLDSLPQETPSWKN